MHLGQWADRKRHALTGVHGGHRHVLRHGDRGQLRDPVGDPVKPRLAGLIVGLLFGAVLAWSGMTSPVVIRGALLFQHAYLFLFFGSAVLTATLGLALLRRWRAVAVFTGRPISWVRETPARRHILGSLLFGLGWGISDACPGPIATQIGQGIGWAVFTLAGVIIGVYAFLRRHQVETEPATDLAPAVSPAAAPQIVA